MVVRFMNAPPAFSSPPPTIRSRIVALVLLAALVALGLFCRRSPTAVLLLKNVVFTALLVLTPSFAKWIADWATGVRQEDDLSDEKHRFVRASVELLFFLILIYGFTFWISGQRLSWLWTLYTALLILLIEAGGHMVEWYKRRILTRVANTGILYASANELRAMDRREPLLYASVPFGIVVAAVIGAIWHFGGGRTLSLALKLIVLSASIGLVIFLLLSLLRMASPIFVEANIAQIRAESNAGVVNRMTVQVPETRKAKKEQRERDLSLLVVISDLRKVYLYNSLHNVVLLAVFAALIAQSTGIKLGMKWWLISSAALIFLLAQLPYVVGQMLMHDRVLRRFEGTERVDMKASLKKYAPALPKSEFAINLIAGNTAGGALFYLLSEFLKDQVKL